MSEGKTNKNYNLIIGRHCLVKSPNYLLGAVKESLNYGANSLMIYNGAPQNSKRQPSSKLKVSEFRKVLQENGMNIDNIVVHGPYLLNLANTIDKDKFD